MLRSLVGSEMCIRDRVSTQSTGTADPSTMFEESPEESREEISRLRSQLKATSRMLETRVLEESATHGCLGDSVKSLKSVPPEVLQEDLRRVQSSDDYDNASCYYSCLLYTSDAADEEDSVDLGGRRIIKKKKKKRERGYNKEMNKEIYVSEE
eukprot:TRINITY_DN3481_c0_g1_i4.p1 TRINITY_DN3481_c0_g1~~TRINITY_DN3481_c0_g1_i4.p1  ORF type:complete len:168 (+),score=66.32 TRINITY_DN3481_c0_g1_i4:46-504(+)